MIKDRLKRRKLKIRRKIVGSDERPRLTVYKSLKSLYVQAIDDSAGTTKASAMVRGEKNTKAATQLADRIYEKLNEAGVSKVRFDRNGKKYHGVVKAFADALRGKGIEL